MEKLRPVPSTPLAGPFAETAAFVRQAFADGRITQEEALRLTEQAYRDTMLAQLGGYPVETGSIQLPETERE